MIYIRKIFKQDLRNGKQIAFPKEPSYVFLLFDYNSQPERKIVFQYKSSDAFNGRKIATRLYPAGSEARIDGELKAFLRDELNANIDDIVLFRSAGVNAFEFEFIPQTSTYYTAYVNLLGSTNHVVGVDQSIAEKISKHKIETRQKIYYGAPGTGKSHTIKNDTFNSDNKITTTFHPDSDYASFVGCYKPQVEDDKIITYKFAPQAFAKAYVSAWRLLLGEPADILSVNNESRYRAWLPENGVAKAFRYYTRNIKSVDVTKYDDVEYIYDISDPDIIDEIIKDQYSDTTAGKHISHMRAHLNKYKTFLQSLESTPTPKGGDKNFYLVIEEINRGNCAQIFGDLFQLLDRREDGFSDYVIDVDKDFTEYLIEELAGLKGYREQICDLANIGDTSNFSYSKIALPCNLSIIATMNTSDQSLFPMDSAFKRRWDWEYIPINASEVEDVIINIGENRYSWSEFITKVNVKIEKAHDSEDKQLGPYFVKATKGIIDGVELKYITQEQFVSKVMFYLWYEVFKDEVSNTIFITKEKKEGQDKPQDTRFTFNKLFAINPESKKSEVNRIMLEKFLGDSLEMKSLPKPAQSEAHAESAEEESVSEQSISTVE